jgi:hypothetical protein
MKNLSFILTLMLSLVIIQAQAQSLVTWGSEKPSENEQVPRNTLKLEVNTMSPEQASEINSYISSLKGDRSILLSTGGILLGILANKTTSTTISEIKTFFDKNGYLRNLLKSTLSRQYQKEEWCNMIGKECVYEDSLTYINSLTDFYAKGSLNSALDPENLQFNGFTVTSQKDGQDVLKFYCHVKTDNEGLYEIFNHSKFRLELDSMYFYPYRCHLPNMSANQIFPEVGKDYDRDIRFSFNDRDNLTLSLSFVISSSWYNEAIILAKDVDLGVFSIQIPINKESLTDSVFVYKKGMKGMPPLTFAGDCFIVPRSYMPLPGGKNHWGTGEFNVKLIMVEQCTISDEMIEDWKKDYRYLKWMKRGKKMKDYFVSIYKQEGNSVMRSIIESTSKFVAEEAGLSKNNNK